MSFHNLSDAFLYAFELAPTSRRATIVTVEHAGNWKAAFQTVQRSFPKFHLDAAMRAPVVFGGEEAIYLEQLGPEGARQFKQNVSELLHAHGKIFVFDTQKIECLRANPGCIDDLLAKGRSISLFFRDAMDPKLSRFLHDRAGRIRLDKQSVSRESVSVLSTELSAQILQESFQRVATELTADEIKVLENLKGALEETVTPEIEDHLLGGSFGVPKLRELARRKIIVAVLKERTPPFSIKSGKDPVRFYRLNLARHLKRFALPLATVAEISPYLSFVVKTTGRYGELRV